MKVTTWPPEEGRLLEFAEVDSTQDLARDLVRIGERGVIGVRADYQRLGRGRSGANWIAPTGTCLLVTYILPLPDGTSTAGMLALGCGVAVAGAAEALTNVKAGLKWPNDVM